MAVLVGQQEVSQDVIQLTEQLIFKHYEHERLTVDDVTEPLQVAVEMWLYGLAFQNFEFLDDVARRVRRQHDQKRLPFGKCLTKAQVKGAANCWRANIVKSRKKLAKKDAPKGDGPNLKEVPVGSRGRGFFAVKDNQADKLRFFRVDKPKEDTRWGGWVFVKEQHGGNFEKVGSQRPDGTYRGEATNLMEIIAASPNEAARLYGQEVGRCCICNTALTDPVSREQGIGPECRKKYPGLLS